MRFEGMATIAVRSVVAFCAAVAGTMILLTPNGSAATANPAFYTYQAPGGATTAGQKVIALTFDDGPGPYTPQVLSVLQRLNVPATFFEIGENVVQYPQYTKMLAAAGYPVEDHTWTHPDLSTIPTSEFPYQIDQTQNEIYSLVGRSPTCVRPPYDAWNATVLSQIAGRGLTTMSYSIDPRDWTMPGVQAIVDAVVGGAFPGAVVDMHDGGGNRSETVAALPQIVANLQSRGYTLVPICQAIAAGNLVENGGFNGSAAGWSLDNPDTNATLYTSGQYEGSGYLATNSFGPWGSIYQDILYPVANGESFCANAEVDAVGGQPASGTMAVSLSGGGGQDSSSIPINVTSATWMPVTTCVTATGERSDIRVQFIPTIDAGTIGIDAVDVKWK